MAKLVRCASQPMSKQHQQDPEYPLCTKNQSTVSRRKTKSMGKYARPNRAVYQSADGEMNLELYDNTSAADAATVTIASKDPAQFHQSLLMRNKKSFSSLLRLSYPDWLILSSMASIFACCASGLPGCCFCLGFHHDVHRPPWAACGISPPDYHTWL